MRRLGCCHHSFPALPHELAVDLISRLGFDGCDLMVSGNRFHLHPEVVRKDVSGWASRLDERVRGRGLEIADLFVIPWSDFETMAPNHPAESERERGAALFADMLELACLLRAPGITTLPGIDWQHESHEESLARAAEELGRRAGQARERGVRFSIEPHAGSVCNAPADAAWLCEHAPGLELTLDYTHHIATGSTAAQVHPLLRHARHFHARGGDSTRLQTSLKQNSINYEAIVDEMETAGYDGFLSVEYLSLDEPGFAAVDVASETVLMRDRLAASLAGRAWTYPGHA